MHENEPVTANRALLIAVQLPDVDDGEFAESLEIGRASCRERV